MNTLSNSKEMVKHKNHCFQGKLCADGSASKFIDMSSWLDLQRPCSELRSSLSSSRWTPFCFPCSAGHCGIAFQWSHPGRSSSLGPGEAAGTARSSPLDLGWGGRERAGADPARHRQRRLRGRRPAGLADTAQTRIPPGCHTLRRSERGQECRRHQRHGDSSSGRARPVILPLPHLPPKNQVDMQSLLSG